ncbi:hypothetical protein HYS48_01560 [Candidatus Woesearchaeota archaeon]|nr:hypothetical protein [Candidatus Woesearchaeota archaeon]
MAIFAVARQEWESFFATGHLLPSDALAGVPEQGEMLEEEDSLDSKIEQRRDKSKAANRSLVEKIRPSSQDKNERAKRQRQRLWKQQELHYFSFEETPRLDYSSLFSYLGKTKTTERAYADAYALQEEGKGGKKVWDDEVGITHAQFMEEMRKEIFNRVYGFLSQPNFELREQYDAEKMLMSVGLKYTLQLLSGITVG